MASVIPLDAIPNQELSIVIGSDRYEIRLIQCVETMAIDIKRNNVMIVQGQRCLPDTLLIPYQYLEEGAGNFIFSTLGDSFPHYDQLGISQYLMHFTESELAVYRG